MAENPQPNRRKTWVIVLIVGAIVLLLVCACVAAVAATGWFAFALPWQRGEIVGDNVDGIIGRVEAQHMREETFQVSTPVLLDINNEVGTVRIIGADQDSVSVQVVVRGYGNTQAAAEEAADRVNVEIRQVEDDHIRLVGDVPPAMNNSPNVDWIVRVPRQTNVQLQNDVGEVQVENIVGSLRLQGGVGDIRVSSFTMTDDSEITMNVGEITVSLPADSAFVLDADASVGDIISEFDVATTRRDSPGAGDSLEGPVGVDPELTLRLRTRTGEIILRAD